MSTPIPVDFNTMSNKGFINCHLRHIGTADLGDIVTLLDADGELTATARVLEIHKCGYAVLGVDVDSFSECGADRP